jgi:hypothetical protein
MCGESTPILSDAIPVFEMFMSKWETLKDNPKTKTLAKAGLETAYKYYNRMDNTKAYVVAMCK